jgi:hypothetical protein
LGAVIGLFLTLGSYTLLQTINPALVQLKLPDIKMVRSSPLKATPLTKGGECYTIKDKESCAATCPGCECHPVCTDDLDRLLATTGGIMIGAPLLAGCAVAAPCLSAAATVGKFAAKVGWKISKAAIYFAINHPIITAGTVYWAAAGPSDGEKGTCYGTPPNSVNDWGLCDSPNECKTGSKCVVVSRSGSSGSGEVCGLKMCSNGEAGRPCNTGNDDNDCATAKGYKCLKTAILSAMGLCGKLGEQPDLTECSKPEDCFGRSCSNGICVAGAGEGRVCKVSPCPYPYDGTVTNGQGGTCRSQKGLVGAGVITSESLLTVGAFSECTNLDKKCASKFDWLYCSKSLPISTFTPPGSGVDLSSENGICLGNSGGACKDSGDCLYECGQDGKCTDWPPSECIGHTK